MGKLLVPFRTLYKIYYLSIFALLMIVTFPLYHVLLTRKKKFRTAFILIRVHSWILMLLTGVIPRIKGAIHIPEKGPFIICANHTSFIDSFCIYFVFNSYFVFTGKKEIEKWPLFHIFYTSGMNIIVDRGSVAGSYSALKRMTEELRKGNSLAIFPEGTRSEHPPKLEQFKSGAFALAIQAQVPIVPVSFISNWKRLGRGGMFTGSASPGFSDIVIHKPVVTKGMKKSDVDVLQSAVEQIISAPILRTCRYECERCSYYDVLKQKCFDTHSL